MEVLQNGRHRITSRSGDPFLGTHPNRPKTNLSKNLYRYSNASQEATDRNTSWRQRSKTWCVQAMDHNLPHREGAPMRHDHGTLHTQLGRSRAHSQVLWDSTTQMPGQGSTVPGCLGLAKRPGGVMAAGFRVSLVINVPELDGGAGHTPCKL